VIMATTPTAVDHWCCSDTLLLLHSFYGVCSTTVQLHTTVQLRSTVQLHLVGSEQGEFSTKLKSLLFPWDGERHFRLCGAGEDGNLAKLPIMAGGYFLLQKSYMKVQRIQYGKVFGVVLFIWAKRVLTMIYGSLQVLSIKNSNC